MSVLVAVALRLRPLGPEARSRFTRRLNRGFGLIAAFVRDMRLVEAKPLELPEPYRGRPVLVIANHPSLLDVVFLLWSIPELVSVVKAQWYGSWLLGPLLQATDHIPGPGFEGDVESGEAAPVVRRIEEALARGDSVLAFPEGTRSPPGGLRRFRRGAIAAAVRTGAPILPLLIRVDPPFLTKGQAVLDVPPRTARFEFDWLEPVETRGGDARELTHEVQDIYRERLGSRRREGRP